MEVNLLHGSFGTYTGENFPTFCGLVEFQRTQTGSLPLEFLITNYVSCVVGKILGAFAIEFRNNLTARPYVLFFNAREQLNCPD